LEIWEETLGPEHPFVAMPLGNLCGMAIDARQLDQASELCERAFVLNERAYGPDHIEVAHVHIWLGNIAGDRGEQDAAWDHYHRALEIAEKAAGPDSVTTGRAARGLGGVLLERGLAGEALPWLERANTILHAEAQDEAAADFSLAQALWDAPKDAGRDRPRSRSLAESARAGLEEKPGLFRDDIDRWLAEHPAPN
ncbi:MAG: tetratricopeptide repeat protein, partial [Myxococcales bacterium]|nr:tetratricopeptide repeat protein [Myxococcales bacterium]